MFPPPPSTAIGNAYAVLSNAEQRHKYDQYGEQAPSESTTHPSAQARHGHYRNFNRDFEADISPEELFNIFFGGRFPTGQFVCVFLKERVGMCVYLCYLNFGFE